MRAWRIWLLALVVGAGMARGQRANVAPTPPMGWNSWDSYGLTIDEAQFRDNAGVLAEKLKPFGWNYAVIDEGWYFENPEDRPHPETLRYVVDRGGRYVPVEARFPSSAPPGGQPGAQPAGGSVAADSRLRITDSAGFKPLADWVHAQGLKFGIHIIRGIPKVSLGHGLTIDGTGTPLEEAADTADVCPWDPTSWGVKDNAAGQAWYDSLIRQYASWGVDFLKVDCIADHPYRVSEIRQIRQAIDRTGRPMVLSLSPGPTNPAHAAEVASLAEMWRISDDVWDVWKPAAAKEWPRTVLGQFDNFALWSPYARPGNWPDGDMLPFGELAPKPDVGPGARRSRLTPAEQMTQLNLWAIARSPLILGANLTMLDDATLRLLTNPEVLRVNQTAVASHFVRREGDLVVWQARLRSGEYAVALFNVGEQPILFPNTNDFPDLVAEITRGLPKFRWYVRDVWSAWAVDSGEQDRIATLALAPHASAMYLLGAPPTTGKQKRRQGFRRIR